MEQPKPNMEISQEDRQRYEQMLSQHGVEPEDIREISVGFVKVRPYFIKPETDNQFFYDSNALSRGLSKGLMGRNLPHDLVRSAYEKTDSLARTMTRIVLETETEAFGHDEERVGKLRERMCFFTNKDDSGYTLATMVDRD